MKEIKVFRDKDGDIWLAGDGIYDGHVVCVTSGGPGAFGGGIPYERAEKFQLAELIVQLPVVVAEPPEMLFPKGYSV